MLTADEELAARVRSLRSHAMTSGTWDRHRGHAAPTTWSTSATTSGSTSRAPRSACRACRALRDDIERRRAAVARYREALAGTPGLDADVDGRRRGARLALRVPCPVRERRRRGAACATRSPTAGSRPRGTPRCTASRSSRRCRAGVAAGGRGGGRPPPRAAALVPQDDDSVDLVVGAVRDALHQG